jgi:hypothetical protein
MRGDSSRVPSLAHLVFGAVLRNASDIELYRILFEAGWDVAIRLYQVVDLPDHQATPHLQPDDFGCVSVGAHQFVQLPPPAQATPSSNKR